MYASKELKAQLEAPRRRKYLELERQIFLQKFQPDEIVSNDLVISPRDFIHYTVVRKVAETPDNVLVILHGFGGFGAVFYRLIEELAPHFFILLVDLPDMGFSSRQNEPLFSDTDSAIEYFASRIHVFVDLMNLTRFSLMGHSIGGLLAAHTFERIHQRVERLYLLSPAGFNPAGDPAFARRKEEMMKRSSFFTRCIWKHFEKKLYQDKESPFDVIWMPMRAKKWLIRKYWNSPRFKMTPEESRLFYKIQAYFLSLPQYGERCLGYLLHYGINSPRPIIDVLVRQKEHLGKVSIFFGETDWMDTEASRARLEENQLEVPFHVVANSEHQLIFQNPRDIATNVLSAHPEWLRKNTLPSF